MKKIIKIEKEKKVINVYSCVCILFGIYFLAVYIYDLFTGINLKLLNYIGLVIPITIIIFCLYFFINKNINKKIVLLFILLVLFFGIIAFFAPHISFLSDIYYLYEVKDKYYLCILGILPLIYLLTIHFKKK